MIYNDMPGSTLPEGAPQRFPNLFLIGAPKCGTTAMSHYLAGHPQIYMTEMAGVKEPCFFSVDLALPNRVCSVGEYKKLFVGAARDIRYWGEASACYLYSRVAVKNILDVSPAALFVIMLRSPIELARSAFNQNYKIHDEIFSEFSEAWMRQKDRLDRGLYMPKGHVDPKLFQYGAIAKLGIQVSRLFEAVPRSRVHVIMFEDFVRDPKMEYLKLLNFLGLEDDGRENFPIMNRSREFRVPAVQKILTRIAVWRRRLNIPGGWGVNALIDRFNAVYDPAKVAPLTEELRAEMVEYFREDVALLGSLLNRDLSHWLDIK